MKPIIRAFLVNLLALYLLNRLVSGFAYSGGFQTLVLAALALAVINFIIKPLVKLFFLPLNILTLGLFSLVINASMIYLLTLIIRQIKIYPWQFPGISYQGFNVPPIAFNFVATLIICAFTVSFVSAVFNWLAD